MMAFDTRIVTLRRGEHTVHGRNLLMDARATKWIHKIAHKGCSVIPSNAEVVGDDSHRKGEGCGVGDRGRQVKG